MTAPKPDIIEIARRIKGHRATSPAASSAMLCDLVRVVLQLAEEQ